MNQRIEPRTSRAGEVISEEWCLSSLMQYAFDNQYAIAVWRLPAESVHHLIISKQTSRIRKEDPIEGLEPGFIFAPFDTLSDRVFLKADLSFSFDGKKLNPPASPLEVNSQAWLTEDMKGQPNSKSKPAYYTLNSLPDEIEKRSFLEMVARGLREIDAGKLEKVVPSRVMTYPLTRPLDVVQIFFDLCESNPSALISFVSTPDTGTWIGATPELLVSVENRNIFKTVALAGTQRYTAGTDLRSVAWTQKDIEEQALVERYIISCFKKIRLREYDEHGPRTAIAGNVLHLKSEFVVDMSETGFPQLGSVMLGLLHPTSAVCGSPLQSSLKFLKEHEGYDRQFYTGYLGPVNFDNNIHIFVNLRCMQLVNDKAILYAGAGVTIDSIPESEWEETEMKLNTLLSVLSNG